MNSGPQAMYMGKPVSRRMLSAVRRLCGQLAAAPTAVLDQSIERMSAPMAPPPASGSGRRVELETVVSSKAFGVIEGQLRAPSLAQTRSAGAPPEPPDQTGVSGSGETRRTSCVERS